MSIQGKNGTSRREVFSRELIVAFYFIFLVMTALCHKFGEVHIVHAFTRIVCTGNLFCSRILYTDSE